MILYNHASQNDLSELELLVFQDDPPPHYHGEQALVLETSLMAHFKEGGVMFGPAMTLAGSPKMASSHCVSPACFCFWIMHCPLRAG